jgi:hypothetical protein
MSKMDGTGSPVFAVRNSAGGFAVAHNRSQPVLSRDRLGEAGVYLRSTGLRRGSRWAKGIYSPLKQVKATHSLEI